jgi:Zn-dependent protease
MAMDQPGENEKAVKADAIAYPPKFRKDAKTSNAWLRSLVSLTVYLILGYYFFERWELLLLITAIVIFHELGHFLAMKYFGYDDLGIFFIPLLGAYVSGSKREVSQKESAIILLAGPLPGMIIGILFYILWQNDPSLHIGSTSFRMIAFLLIILNLFNLLPIYPLDGGQLLNRVFFDEESWVSRVFIFLSIGALVFFAIKLKFYLLLIFPLYMLFRMLGDRKNTGIEKEVEAAGIQTDLEYEDLPDEDYWKIRDILVSEHPSFRDLKAGPPYEYDDREEKIMNQVNNLLHRHLIQDVPVAGKLLILCIWVAAMAAPWLMGMNFRGFFL